MSKLSSGKFELSHEPFDISKIVYEVFTIANTTAQKNGIKLLYENASDTRDYPLTYGSPLHVTRVLLNIVGNSIKYNKQGGSVRIRLEHDTPENGKIKYIITISDTGIGMSEEYIQNLFEPFSQERIDARSVYNGSGLGMAITKALIDIMEGTIDVNSKQGEGTTFVISIPFEIASSEESCGIPEDEEERIDGLHILLAEDNELNIEIAKTLLEDFGAVVDVAENGQAAFDNFRNNPSETYDLILMDCMMPVMDGFETTKAIRELNRPDAKTIPIIAMTANAFADDVKKCLEAGMNDHLPKPFEIQRVTRTIRQYVSTELK